MLFCERMRKRLTALALALSLAAPAMAAAPAQASPAPAGSGWLTSLAEARKAAAAGRRHLLVDLYADWCGWCKVLDREVFSSPKFKQRASKFVLLRVDVEDGGEGSMLQSRFEAYSLPTTLVLDHDLALVGRIEGYAPVDAFLAGLDAEISAHGELMARFEKEKASSDLRVLQALAGELYNRSDGRRAAAVYQRMLDGAKPSPVFVPRIEYQIADSWRLAGEVEKARVALEAARRDAAARKDAEIIEASDLLAARIAQASGDCLQAIAALEAFLKQYPKSEFQAFARHNLRSLKQQGPSCS